MRKISIQAVAVLLTVSILFASIFGLFLPIRTTSIPVLPPSGNGDTSSEPSDESPDTFPEIPEEDSPSHENEDSAAPPASEGENNNDPGAAPEQDPDIPAAEETPTHTTYIRSKVDGLSLRSGPGTGYTALGHINKGDMVTFLDEENGWYRTRYKNKIAYISANSSYTEAFEIPLSQNDIVEKVIEEGLSLLGFPYVYGAIRLHDGKGNLLKNFDATEYDCSSLMQYIFYYGAGVNLNMTTRTQVTQGTSVKRADLQRGDLMFFTNSTRYNKTGVERIGHVALYLGNNYILHTASDYAVIEQISTQRWNYYIETRRVA